MRVVSIEAIPASIPYDRREVSAQVARDGVTDVVVKVTTDNGLVGWGESCSGADVVSVCAAIEAMKPFVLGRDPWHRERIQADLWHHGLWQFRPMTGNFAWAGIDMALWDLVGKELNRPLHQLLGGNVRDSVSYFYYLSRGTPEDLAAQCANGLTHGYGHFYLKVGLDPSEDQAMVDAVREALGPGPRLRLDANAAWTVSEALRHLRVLSQYDIDFIEQPVREHPLAAMAEVRARCGVPVAANEGLWTKADTLDRLAGRVADVFCFSPYWVGPSPPFRGCHGWRTASGWVCANTPTASSVSPRQRRNRSYSPSRRSSRVTNRPPATCRATCSSKRSRSGPGRTGKSIPALAWASRWTTIVLLRPPLATSGTAS